jgi:hypothetical protein
MMASNFKFIRTPRPLLAIVDVLRVKRAQSLILPILAWNLSTRLSNALLIVAAKISGQLAVIAPENGIQPFSSGCP